MLIFIQLSHQPTLQNIARNLELSKISMSGLIKQSNLHIDSGHEKQPF